MPAIMPIMVEIRRALPGEAPALTALAARAEAHWGFDPAYMDSFRCHYAVTEAFLEASHAFVAVDGEAILGFYALVPQDSAAWLEFLYIDPPWHGRGIGRTLWNHLTGTCRRQGWDVVRLVCGPEPAAFYLKMGASRVGEEASKVVPGRRILRLELSLSRVPDRR